MKFKVKKELSALKEQVSALKQHIQSLAQIEHNRIQALQQSEISQAKDREKREATATKFLSDRMVGAQNQFTAGYINCRVEITKHVLQLNLALGGGMLLYIQQGMKHMDHWVLAMILFVVSTGMNLFLVYLHPELLGRAIRMGDADGEITKDNLDRFDGQCRWLSTLSIVIFSLATACAAFYIWRVKMS